MHFTREPLTETIITPREGYKLLLRAVGACQEEYIVDSVEVVVFGACWFFRSLEKPRVFLLPMLGYEVIEIRETRTVLKKPQVGKTVKIGTKKKASLKVVKTKEEEQEEEEGGETPPPKEGPKKAAKKWARTRRPKTEKGEGSSEKKDENGVSDVEKAEPMRRTTLLPPPTSLISEQIGRYKHYLVEHGVLPPEEEEEGGNQAEGSAPSVASGEGPPLGEEVSSSTSGSADTDKVVDIDEEA